MLSRWIRFIFWSPFETACRKTPIIPLKFSIETVTPSVELIRIDNILTRAISKLGGSYDYSVSYLIDKTLLIDTGFPWARKSMKKHFMLSGLCSTIKYTVNTHSHEDHIGNNDLIKEITSSKIYIHKSGINTAKFPRHLPWYRNFMFGPPPSSNAEPIPDKINFNGFEFLVLHLPGHSPDHICLFEPNKKWLFSGDLYISADLDSQLREVDGPAWILSLERAIALKPLWMFDSHGIVFSGEQEVFQALNNKLQFLNNLRNKVFEVGQTATSVNEIVAKVFSKKNVVNQLSFSDGWLSLLTSSDFSRTHLVQSFLNNTNPDS